MALFNKTGVNRENITQKFFSDSEYGIAKTKTSRVGFPFNTRYVTKPIQPEIEDALNNAFSNAKFNAGAVSQDDSLSYLLYIISSALDKVIDEKCNLN